MHDFTRKKMEKRNGKRIVLIPGPFQSHFNPILQLAKVLHSTGFSITIGHSTLISPTPNNGFIFLPIPDGLSRIDASSMLFIDVINEVNIRSKKLLRQKLGEMKQDQRKDRIACLIYDSVMVGSVESVANDLGIARIVFEPVCAAVLVTNMAYPLLQQEGFIPLQQSMSQDLLPTECHPFRFKDLPIHNFYHYEAFLKMISTMTRTKTPSAYIVNTIDCLEHLFLSKLNHIKHPIPVFQIGPLHKIIEKHQLSSTSLLKEDTSCITWLNKQSPSSVIYVSTGSLSEIEDNELIETAWGLVNSGQPFLLTVRPESTKEGGNWMSRLLGSGYEKVVEKRGCVVEWAPQKEVLMHKAVGGFWSHCGWNSTLESVCEGVPMICWPRVGDHNICSRYRSHVWRVGFELEEMERGEIEKIVRKLIVDKEGDGMRERALGLKMKIEGTIKEDGSSYTCLNNLEK